MVPKIFHNSVILEIFVKIGTAGARSANRQERFQDINNCL